MALVTRNETTNPIDKGNQKPTTPLKPNLSPNNTPTKNYEDVRGDLYNGMRSSAHGLQENRQEMYDKYKDLFKDDKVLWQQLSTVNGLDQVNSMRGELDNMLNPDKGGGGGGRGGGGYTQNVYNPYFDYLNNYYGGGGTPSEVGSTDYSTMRDDYLTQMKALLDEERAQRDKATESQYKALIGQADRSYGDTRNQIERNNAQTQRWLDETYGGYTTGAGLTNRLRASTNRENNLADALKNRSEAYQSAETQRQNSLADAVQNYSSQYNNIAKNMYDMELNNEYNKYKMNLEDEQQKRQQALDYQYRMYLKQLGL